MPTYLPAYLYLPTYLTSYTYLPTSTLPTYIFLLTYLTYLYLPTRRIPTYLPSLPAYTYLPTSLPTYTCLPTYFTYLINIVIPHRPPSLRHFVTQGLLPLEAIMGCGFSLSMCGSGGL